MPLTNDDIFVAGSAQGFAEGVETMIRAMEAGIEEADRTIADPEVDEVERRACGMLRDKYVELATGFREGLATAMTDFEKVFSEFPEKDRAILESLRAPSQG